MHPDWEKVLKAMVRAKQPLWPAQPLGTASASLLNEWRGLRKSKTKKSSTQAEKETAFKDKFADLLGMAHADALERLTIDEDTQKSLKIHHVPTRKRSSWMHGSSR